MTAEDYVRRVAYELRDLPWRMKRELVADLRRHLEELPEGTDFTAQLGRPHEYAAELREAEGLERRRGVLAFLQARRPRNLILAAVVLTVVGLAIGAVVWIDSYQPLQFGDTFQFPVGTRAAPGLNGESAVFHKGGRFQLGMNVFNNGRFTVRVLGVPYQPPTPWSARLLMSATQKYTGGVNPPFRPFHPVDLEPGDSIYLVLRGAYACHMGMGSGTSVGYDYFPLRYRFLWRTATTDIPFGQDLAIVFPRGCPAPSPSTP